MDKAKFYNPFRPTAGAEPPRIIGRDDISLEFVEGLMSGVAPPHVLCELQAARVGENGSSLRSARPSD